MCFSLCVYAYMYNIHVYNVDVSTNAFDTLVSRPLVNTHTHTHMERTYTEYALCHLTKSDYWFFPLKNFKLICTRYNSSIIWLLDGWFILCCHGFSVSLPLLFFSFSILSLTSACSFNRRHPVKGDTHAKIFTFNRTGTYKRPIPFGKWELKDKREEKIQTK